MKITIYQYASLLTNQILTNTCNFWTTEQEIRTGLYQSEHSSLQLLATHEFEVPDIQFDFTSGKIQALECKLGNLEAQATNIKAQIQELKCIGHDEDFQPNGGVPQPAEFDDDVGF